MTAIRRRLALFLGVVALTLGLALAVTLLRPSRYMATAEIIVDMATAPGAGAVSADDRLSTEMAILRSREMAHQVAMALHLGDARAETDRLMKGLSVTRPDQTYALAIGFTDADPEVAARIANAYARAYAGEGGRPATAEVSARGRMDARIISLAEPPLTSTASRLWVNLAVALVIGLILGAIAAIMTERRFSGLTGSAEIEKRLGLYHLGSVPTLSSVLPEAASPLQAVVDAPMSGFAESFRSVMLAARHVGGKGTQVIAITSSLPNEGKSTIAACLARTTAMGGESVLLIDCDSRRRDVSAMFGATATAAGLQDVLRLEKTLDEALIRDEASGACILPLTGGPEEISELLGGPAMDQLIAEVRRRFKRVLIDTAPILPISATRALVSMADITVMVVRWRTTADHAVQTALRMLPAEHVRIGGVVLSQVDMRRQVKYGRGDQTFYYQQYSKYYS